MTKKVKARATLKTVAGAGKKLGILNSMPAVESSGRAEESTGMAIGRDGDVLRKPTKL